MDYSSYLSSNIRTIASIVDETLFQLPVLLRREKLPVVELFDFKSCDLFKCSSVSDISTFRLLLMQYRISYILLLIESLLDFSVILNDDLWTCFFTKLLAIQYDESFDNLQSLMKFSNDVDKAALRKSCIELGLSINELKARQFAQNLRNTIHYQELLFSVEKMTGETTRHIVTALYLSNTDTTDIDEFRGKMQDLITEMKLLVRW